MKAVTKVSGAAIVNVEYFSDKVVDAFVVHSKGSAATMKTYRNSVKRLIKWFAVKGIAQPIENDFDEYISELRLAGKANSTLRLYHTVGKMFFGFLAERGIYRNIAAGSKLKNKKKQTHSRKSLSLQQAKNLLASVKGDDEKAMRDRCIIALSLQTGLRTCEIERMDVKDLGDDEGGYHLLAVQGKGELTKNRFVKVSPTVAKMIYAYWDKRGVVSDDSPAFTSTSGNRNWSKNKYGSRLSAQSVGKLIKRHMLAADIKDKQITAHSTRHFAATTAIKAGVELREVSAMLRHTSVVITSTYLHDLSEETRRAELAVADSLFGGAA